MQPVEKAYQQVKHFKGDSLRERIYTLEANLQGANKAGCISLYTTETINSSLLQSAITLKRAASQINEVVHALGILLSLPYILYDHEVVQSLSLAAGNTGRPFDLETNFRVAEFKFIDWRGGPEAIRQNQLFKDFYSLAEYDTPKARFLYVVGLEHPLKFLNSKRAIRSVMSRNNKLWEDFRLRYGKLATVRDYYNLKNSQVALVDLRGLVPEIAEGIESDAGDDEDPDVIL